MARFHTLSATMRPSARPARSSDSKCIPHQRRDIPASSAASEKVAQESVTAAVGVRPGSINDDPGSAVNHPPKASLPVNLLRISAPAALNALCPETNEENGGVGRYVRKFLQLIIDRKSTRLNSSHMSISY